MPGWHIYYHPTDRLTQDKGGLDGERVPIVRNRKVPRASPRIARIHPHILSAKVLALQCNTYDLMFICNLPEVKEKEPHVFT